MTENVFVYGTLKKGCLNERYLVGCSDFVGEAATVDKYPMICSSLPYLLNVPGRGNKIKGELYRVETATLTGPLDRLEGHPNFYARSKIFVECGGQQVEAWTYFAVVNQHALAALDQLEFYNMFKDNWPVKASK